jgi:hypothetical protein
MSLSTLIHYKILEIFREFDPGSGWTLAVCLTHASRTEVFKTLVADGWVTRENLPLGGEQQLEMTANAPYALIVKWIYPPEEKLASD